MSVYGALEKRRAGHSPRMVLDYTVADVDRAKDLAQRRRDKGRVN